MKRNKVKAHSQGKIKLIETVHEESPDICFIRKHFKSSVLSILTELKKIRTKSHQITSINKQIQIINRNQIEMLEMKRTINKMKTPLKEFNNSFKQEEE